MSIFTGKEISLGKIFGIEITIDYSWFWILLLVTYSFAAGLLPSLISGRTVIEYAFFGFLGAVLLFVSVLIHELAHSLVARANKLPVKKITLFLFGGAARLVAEPANARTEIYMASVGPIASFIIGAIFYVISLFGLLRFSSSLFFTIIQELALVNVILGGFNLLPGYPLDGGRIFRGIIWWWTRNLAKATKIASIGGQVIAYGLMGWGVYQIFFSGLIGGVWLILIGSFLLHAAQRSYKLTLATIRLRKLKVEDVMDKNLINIDGESTLREFADLVFETKKEIYLVQKEGENIGIIFSSILSQIPKRRWVKKVIDIMKPLEKLQKISIKARATKILEKIEEGEENIFAVYDEDRFVGLVSPNDLSYYLKFQEVTSVCRK